MTKRQKDENRDPYSEYSEKRNVLKGIEILVIILVTLALITLIFI